MDLLTMNNRTITLLLVVATLGIVCDDRLEAANCILRNPDRQIYKFFPEATNYRSVMAMVDQEDAEELKKKYGVDLDIGDLGKNTLYYVMKDGVPVGFVHARTQVGERGSIELVFVLDLDLKLTDFVVQRSRERYTKIVKAADFRSKFGGRDLAGLMRYLTPEGTADLDALGVPAEAAPIVNTTTISAVKCIAITRTAFAAPVMRARLLGIVYREFPGTAAVRKVTLAEPVDTSQLDFDSMTVLRAVGVEGKTEGLLVFATWKALPDAPETWWSIAPDGSIRNVWVTGGMGDQTPDVMTACAGEIRKVLSSNGMTANERVVQGE